MRIRSTTFCLGLVALGLSACGTVDSGDSSAAQSSALGECVRLAAGGLRPVAETRDQRFLGKVQPDTAKCRGGDKALAFTGTPWVDWQNYWATGDASSKSSEREAITKIGEHLKDNGRGIDGALIDLEYQRIELIKFNLFDNATFVDYVVGTEGVDGRAVKVWAAMKLRPSHEQFQAVGGEGAQLCKGDLIRHRTVTGICNDIRNPLMGSTNQPFARNVEFEETFPRLGRTELVRNRHGDRLGLLKPDPQVVSRVLFTRQQSDPEKCREGQGLPGYSREARCDYKPAPFFNVLAAFWIQFMNHDWFSHLSEGRNDPRMMRLGCTHKRVGGVDTLLTPAEQRELGCRPEDRMDTSLYAKIDQPGSFSSGGKTYLARAPRTTANTVTAWWDASQLYGYDESSRQRVKRDLEDTAKLMLEPARAGRGERNGYLPLFEDCAGRTGGADCTPDPIHPSWAGQEATAFPDNWTVGLSFYHNVFAREHNAFVEVFRKQGRATPGADSGLRNPARPEQIIRYQDVTPDELFEVARLVVSAEIAKIHTIEWTPQLLYNEPLYLGMNSNWSGLFEEDSLPAKALERVVVNSLAKSTDADKATTWYSVFASGPGIFGLGSRVYESGPRLSRVVAGRKDIWDLSNPDHVNGGTNHFGSPFNFPEEFITVYRLHPLVPDLIELRDLQRGPDAIHSKVPVVATFRGRATAAMREDGLADWGLSMGRQRLGALTLQNHAQFLQNLTMQRLDTPTKKIDVVALDLIRDRERGIPRFNEFRRQYGLKQLTSFDDFVDRHLPENAAARKEQEALVAKLREVYGQHRCDASKIITRAQRNDDGTPINDCLGNPDGTMVDNIEDVDTVVGWLAEFTRPHGFAISETQFQVFILNASRRLFSDRFFTSSFRPEFYSNLGVAWVNDNGPLGKVIEKGLPNGHEQEVSPLKRVLLRTIPELTVELEQVVNVFDPWARDRGEYYSLEWKPRPGAEADEAF